MNKGRTTIHDLTALSLHPTGSRAQPYRTNSLQDGRGNWIATDAGGWGAVPRRRAVDSIESGGKDRRARKRRKLVHDVDFISGQDPHTAPIEVGDDSSLELSTPSVRLFRLTYLFIFKTLLICTSNPV